MREQMRTHDYSHPVDTTPPKVCVVVVYHRDPDNTLLLECLESLSLQSYPNIECITVDNRGSNENPSVTIGAARNAAVRTTDAPLVMFVMEEDMLTIDTVQLMVDMWKAGRKEHNGLLHITTPVKILLENGTHVLDQRIQAPGMFDREFLLAEPFDEELHHPDNAMLQKLEATAKLRGVPVTFGTMHHFGYVLRAIPFRRDGVQVRTK